MKNYNLTNKRNESQPYVSWKGIHESYNTFTSSNSRPFNNQTIQQFYNVNPVFNSSRKIISSNNNLKAIPRPLKHWRRQLFPHNNSGNNKINISELMDKPGSHITSNKNCDHCPNANKGISYINKEIFCSNQTSCKTRIRNITFISDNIFSSSKEYLQNRVKTYEQNKDIQRKPNNNYFDPPTNSDLGSQSFYSLYKPNYLNPNTTDIPADSFDCSMVNITYKPNNNKFAKTGAVSCNEFIHNKSSANTTNYYYVNQTNNNRVYTTWGIDDVKNTWGIDNIATQKPTKIICSRKLGNHTQCFYTDPSQIEKNYEKGRKTIKVKLHNDNPKLLDNKHKCCLKKQEVRRGDRIFDHSI